MLYVCVCVRGGAEGVLARGAKQAGPKHTRAGAKLNNVQVSNC